MNKSKINDSKKKENSFYVTTPIYYASGKPHLGHAYTSICCDAIARWNRNIGKSVFFMTGTDEHGQKIQKKADDAKKTPKEFVDSLIPEFKNQLEVMDISYDYFIRTTDEKHKKFIQKMLQKSFDNGDIYKGVYEGLYCIDCEQYYKTEDLLENNVCPVHKKKVESVKEENYFFRLSKYQNKLLDFYKKNPAFLSPKSKAQETINRVKEELIDISISRSKKTLSWGIELPFDKSHVTYVWFDALFNYLSGLEINQMQDFWPADVHVVGKDIMWFHKVYWPAFLMSTGYDLPKKVFAHGWWTVNGEKMGKALGNVIDPIEVAKKYGTDEFRYFVISSGTFGDDMDFSYEKFREKINNELNNDFGNLISRVHAMTGKYFEGKIPKISKLMSEDLELLEKLNIYEKFNFEMQELRFNFAIEILWNAIRETNAYINKTAPYKETNKERLGTIINLLASSCVLFAKYVNCFMPKKAEKIFKQFNVKNDGIFKLEFLEAGHKLAEKENLFTKIEMGDGRLEMGEKKQEKKSEKTQSKEKKEGFSSLNLKLGKIIEAKHHPNSEKLFIEKIDVGEKEPRQIVSGLVGFYTVDELIGKKVIVAINLKPAKLRGEISQGMVLAAESEEGTKVGLLLADLKVGDNLVCNREIADNESQITIDDFLKVQMISKGNKIYFNENEITLNNKSIKTDKNIVGKIR